MFHPITRRRGTEAQRITREGNWTLPSSVALCLSSACLVFLALVASPQADNWPQWRGPQLNGTSRDTGLPVKWDAATNIAWKLKLPGWSASTPAVWDDRVFVNIADGDALSIAAVDRAAGKVVWQRPLGGGNRKERKQNLSSPSPV